MHTLRPQCLCATVAFAVCASVVPFVHDVEAYTLFMRPGEVSETLLVELTNEARSIAGVGGVEIHPLVQTAAQHKAADMARLESFQHTLSSGDTAWDYLARAGYRYALAGENLAVHFVKEEDVIDAWLHSPTHRMVLLNSDYEHVGIGIARGEYKGHSGLYIVQLFARERTHTP